MAREISRRDFLKVLSGTSVLGMQPLPVSQAASRQEMAAIQVVQAKDFRYWTADSPVKAALVQYVEKVIDRKSPDFIPAADRVAVFDMDGTLMCETAPSYFDSLLYQKRVLDDGSWQPSADMRAAAVESRSALQQKRHSRMGEEEEEAYQMNAFDGMEGVLVPEIWIAFADAAGIPDLRRTTRDEPDYDKLMPPT